MEPDGQTEDRAMLKGDKLVRSTWALSDVLQDIKDKLHNDGLFSPRAAPAVDDRDQNAVQGIEVLSWERLPIAPGHKSNLKRQNKP